MHRIGNHFNQCCFVYEVEGEGIVGAVIGAIVPYFFGNDLIACDDAIYVKEKFRNFYAARKLINKFSEWGKSKGAKEICLGLSSGLATDRTKKLYEYLGFESHGYILKKRVK